MSAAGGLNADFLDLLRALKETGVLFVVVGAHALAVHGAPRATGDLDVLVEPSHQNAELVIAALRRFGAPLEAHDISTADFATPDTIYQIGVPPRRIDLMTTISGVPFAVAWKSRVEIEIEDLHVPFLGREALIENKRAAGRSRDALDLDLLGETRR